ncbi:hypothetical protein D9758_002986 [Tetrapyrgos nigripes]|uniref:Uncharacterized protein n=1 Tax=Tetrapyrgos nigripes TaxID=182062 RepID=A0A8H5GQK8_9AGAR|nr:hypothetical protein D9758_002986 [Tetrapyrgos nigripes]
MLCVESGPRHGHGIRSCWTTALDRLHTAKAEKLSRTSSIRTAQATYLFAVFTSPRRICDVIYNTPGAVSLVVELLWVRSIEKDILNPGSDDITGQHVIWHFKASCSKDSNRYLKNAIQTLDSELGTKVLQSLNTHARKKLNLRKLHEVTISFYFLRKYSRKFRFLFLSLHAMNLAITLFRKLVLLPALSGDEAHSRKFRCAEYLMYLSYMVDERGHTAIIEMLRSRLLFAMMEAVPYIFLQSHSDPEHLANEVQKPYFRLLDGFGLQAIDPSVLKVLSKSISAIEKEGFDRPIEKAPESMKRRWAALKQKVQDLIGYKEIWKQPTEIPR